MTMRVNREIALIALLLFFIPLVGLVFFGWAESEQRDLDNKLAGKESPIRSVGFDPEASQKAIDALQQTGSMIFWPPILICLAYLAFRVVKMLITGSWFLRH